MKGSHTFTAQSAAEEDHKTEEDQGPKPNGKDTMSSGEEDMRMSGKVGDVDPSLGFITWFINAVELYQKGNAVVLGVAAWPKDLEKTTKKVGLNLKEETAKKGSQSSYKLVVTQQATPGNAPQG